ncbi:MAG: ABC transporter ATP-binding protein [Oscillospiraceae bacterium]|nr:ABC transporter ATP-binding protein [Oscillospiraceae bacterium]
MNIIETSKLVKRYKQHTAVDKIDLDVREGEVFGLLGPNGAGKSTLIGMLVGTLKVTEGSVRVLGKDISRDSSSIKQDIGYVPQDLAFFEKLSAYDNVIYWGRLYGLRGPELKAAVQEALEFTGLWERRKDTSENFSGGMKRRLNIACAIVHKPKLLFMDEPTVGVDPQSRNSILESIRKLNHNGTTVIYTSHYMEEVEAICDRVGIMDFGKLIAIGTIDQLVTETVKEEFATIEINNMSLQLAEAIKRIPGVTYCDRNQNVLTIHVNPEIMSTIQLLEMLISKRIDIKAINVEKPNLETVFLTLTGKKLRD